MQQIRPNEHEVAGCEEKRVAGVMRAEPDNEINLSEYVASAIKRKNLVASIFFGAVLCAGIWSVLSPKIYDVSVIIGPPTMSVTDSGVQDFDSIGNIKAEIESGAFNARIISELNLSKKALKFDVSQPRDAKLIRVSLRNTAEQSDIGKKTLAKLVEVLNLNYARYIEDKRNRIENQIKIAENQISRKQSGIKEQDEQFKIMMERERQYADDIREAKANSEKLAINRMALIDRKENKDDVAALLFVATIQQNISYITQLQNELSAVRIQKEKILNGIENLKNGINEDRIGIENLKLSESAMRNIAVIQEPLVSLQPIGPKPIRNMLIAGVIGLIAGIILVSFAGRC